MREFYTNFVSHEIALVIFSNAFFSSFPTVEFLSSNSGQSPARKILTNIPQNHIQL
jgi:hypothetical protein